MRWLHISIEGEGRGMGFKCESMSVWRGGVGGILEIDARLSNFEAVEEHLVLACCCQSMNGIRNLSGYTPKQVAPRDASFKFFFYRLPVLILSSSMISPSPNADVRSHSRNLSSGHCTESKYDAGIKYRSYTVTANRTNSTIRPSQLPTCCFIHQKILQVVSVPYGRKFNSPLSYHGMNSARCRSVTVLIQRLVKGMLHKLELEAAINCKACHLSYLLPCSRYQYGRKPFSRDLHIHHS